MSELKWNWVYYPYLDAPNEQEESALKAGYIKVVDKSEADKVIAELKDKLDLYKRGWEENDKVNENLYAQLRHHKYKRCLKNREICVMRCDIEFARQYPTRAGFFVKWERKWLEFAEKFKEAK